MEEKIKKRGILLTIWLWLIIIQGLVSVVVSIVALTDYSLIESFYPQVSNWIYYSYILIGLSGIVFAVYLFKWKKWAFYANCAVAVIATIINVMLVPGISSYGALLSPVILYLLIRPKWNLLA